MRGCIWLKRTLPALALLICIGPAQARDVTGYDGIRGAGSSFAYPLISKWSREYRTFQARGGEYPTANGGLDDALPTTALDYEPTGSLAGSVSIRQGSVDFAASDVPLAASELARSNLVQFPVVMGGIVVAVNVAGVKSEQLRLSGSVLAAIFAGTTTRWTDPAIISLNPQVSLPDAAITVIHRSDGSGTTANFTKYLSLVSKEWDTRLGSDLLIKWPVGRGAKGNSGVAAMVKSTANSIGYLDYTQARQAALSLVQLQNRSGEFVPANPASFQRAAANVRWDSAQSFDTSLSNAANTQSYPMVTTVFVLVPSNSRSGRTDEVLDLFEWALEKGQKSAQALGYVPLPDVLVKQIEAHWALTLRK